MPFPIEPQERNEWCWAAVCVSTDHYFDHESTLTQCELAGDVLGGGRIDCCKNPNACDKTMELQPGLEHLKMLAETVVGPVHFLDIKNEIDAGRPVAARLAWFGGGAHFVVICGYALAQSGLRTIQVADPLYGQKTAGKYDGIWDVDFDMFPEHYQEGGYWTATFMLKSKRGETP